MQNTTRRRGKAEKDKPFETTMAHSRKKNSQNGKGRKGGDANGRETGEACGSDCGGRKKP